MSSQKQLKVIVCGAGIGGLTVAHELAKHNVQVVVYERNPIIGGLARSAYHRTDQGTYPVEYSWRVYGNGYKNLLRILKEIPLHDQPKASVRDNLLEAWTYLFPRFGKSEIILSREEKKSPVDFEFSWREKLRIFEKLASCLLMSRTRMDSLDDVRWQDFCADLSPEAKKYLVTLWGPVLGMDPTYMSFPVIARMVSVLVGGYMDAATSLFLMKKPTNDGWFDEWAAHLRQTGHVTIKTNCEVQDMTLEDEKIKEVILRDRETGEIFIDQADEYVCGLSVESIADIVSKNRELSKSESLQKTLPLAHTCRQIQLSVQIFLDQKITYPTRDVPILYLPDSPWALIIEPQELVWGKTHCSDPRVKSVWSVGICQTDTPGIVYGKPFIHCTEKEIQEEVWAQIHTSYEYANIKTEDGSPLQQTHILLFYLWESFTYDQQKKEITTWEPKFSNNAGSLKYQPASVTEIPNLRFATGYTKTHRFIYSMEAAAEAGTRCANEILHAHLPSAQSTVVFPTKTSFLLLKPLIGLDWILYKLGAPHISKILRSSLVIVGIYLMFLLLLIRGLSKMLI